MRLGRKLFSSTTRAIAYAAVGVVACAVVLVGFATAWRDARQPEPMPDFQRAAQTAEREPSRHVPPLPVTYPFF